MLMLPTLTNAEKAGHRWQAWRVWFETNCDRRGRPTELDTHFKLVPTQPLVEFGSDEWRARRTEAGFWNKVDNKP